MSEVLTDLLIGLADGRVLRYITENVKRYPKIQELTPATRNIKKAVLKIIKPKQEYRSEVKYIGKFNR